LWQGRIRASEVFGQAARRLEPLPLPLSVMIEAPREEMLRILEKHPQARSLFDNNYLHLFAMMDGRLDARYAAVLGSIEEKPQALAA
jgi:uncharacterized protein YbcC (UPF0753/DUF2309 family)